MFEMLDYEVFSQDQRRRPCHLAQVVQRPEGQPQDAKIQNIPRESKWTFTFASMRSFGTTQDQSKQNVYWYEYHIPGI